MQTLFDNTRQTLLEQRGPHGHWEGELASSALSTATAVIALDSLRQAGAAPQAQRLQQLVDGGLAWLASTQNDDGGWGDTVLSKSNISTTTLVWAAFARSSQQFPETMRGCEAWIGRAAGGLEPQTLAQAIVARYGKDRTFSVPILTTLVLCNRLGDPAQAWRLVPQLPFELAAFPHRWYATLRLPVVSYALPALIAIGQVRHHHAPSPNPLTRGLRNLTRQRTLRVLESIQPTSGGFLEATPLTSFVTLSLIGAGQARHPVVEHAVRFLIASVREDGSWPIDTNLATWVTTLAVNALHTAHGMPPAAEANSIRDWLVAQQYRERHPYTNAAPGGWAWTDLTGGVPDADDTPGALLALWHLSGPSAAEHASAGVRWLLDLQNADGGLPTFCRGWGALPFDRSSADLTAHALRAWSVWQDHLPALQQRIRRGTRRGLAFLKTMQQSDGAWAPLWFGNQHATTEENLTYGTSRVVLALATISPRLAESRSLETEIMRGLGWLLSNQNDDGGWGGGAGTPSSIEETALTVESLAAAMPSRLGDARLKSAISRGLNWLVERTETGRSFPPAPIGFYFAKLWYYEKLYPLVYTLAAAGRCLKIP